jgi:hypothetical protein
MNTPAVENHTGPRYKTILSRILNQVTIIGWFAAIAFSLPASAHAATFKWIDATASELAMTSYAKALGAPAIILSYDESEGGYSGEVIVHVRVKVLNESGLSAANVNLPLTSGDLFEPEIYARTIHPSGAIIPYTGKPLNQIDGVGRGSRVITLPDVSVGSILEYGYRRRSQSFLYLAPHWVIQHKYFVCAAHFRLDTSDIDPPSVRWVSKLPAGAELKRTKNSVELNLTDVPALPDEEFMPPPSALQYGVSFFYWAYTRDSYWGRTADNIDHQWKDFYTPRKILTDSVHQIIAPGDTDELKLHKLYDAVMAMENTDLTRERSEREDKASGLKETHNSEEIWLRKRGSSDELALLYVALARAAGFQAYPMAVTRRTGRVFNLDLLNWAQMEDVIAVVMVKGQEFFFDPGTRYCPFGHLAWWHSNVGGISFEGKQLKTFITPSERLGAHTQRVAELKLDSQGNVEGTVTIAWNNIAALFFRRQFLSGDQHAVETNITSDLQDRVPTNVQLKLITLKGLDTYNDPLVATFSVSGKLGIATGKRLVVPAAFFAGRDKPMFSPQVRTLDISFPEIYAIGDAVQLTLPASLTVEALPETRTLEVAKDSGYQVHAITAQGKVVIQRNFFLKRLDYPVQDYGALRQYFGAIAGSDQNALVLHSADQ